MSPSRSPVTQFQNNQDDEYGLWLAAYPSGFVVNDRGHGNYLLIHRADSYRCIKQSGKNHTSPRAVSTKVCSLERTALEAWCVSEFGRRPEPCKHCF
jgi:hypothetical protein